MPLSSIHKLLLVCATPARHSILFKLGVVCSEGHFFICPLSLGHCWWGLRTSVAARAGPRAQAAAELARGLPDEAFRSWLLYSTLDQASRPSALAQSSRAATKLSGALQSTAFDLGLTISDGQACFRPCFLGITTTAFHTVADSKQTTHWLRTTIRIA